MCGIVGYIGGKPAAEILLDGLSRLEYRGYDSAGIAVVAGDRLQILRSQGKLAKLRELVQAKGPEGSLGIGHTRWATHGRPSEANAHPHRYGKVTVVHNGIIENFTELREALLKKGHHFSSETDTEIIAHLIDEELGPRTPTVQAFRKALHRLRGSFAVAMLCEGEPGTLYAARSGSPLVLGLGEGENYVASDVPALLPYTKRVVFLEDGEVAVLDRKGVQVQDLSGKAVRREAKTITWTLAMAEKAGYKHFMLKEIFEQPRALADTLRGHLDLVKSNVYGDGAAELFKSKAEIEKVDKIYLVACGTSWHAALVGKYFLERDLKTLVMVEQASEFRYRDPILDKRSLVVAISQSGETADTLTAIRNAKAKGAKVLAITNVVDSSIARESDAVLYTYTGPEIGVAATKTFTAQIVTLHLVGLLLGRKKGTFKKEDAEAFLHELLEVPGKIEEVLKQSEAIRELALKYAHSDDCLFIGRGPQFPIALEGALKLKEISYLHAEGYPAGELKHGPIALIDHGSPVVAIALKDEYYEKMASNIQEVLSRQAAVLALATEGDKKIRELTGDVIYLPKAHPLLTPILSAVPLQLFAYYIADHRGHDVDQPRNLAKSVTVE
ncbi:glutamine--fructose-6-phosphate transaminase (isomerizing) [Deltaproteobacteria bacterium PRO3]|nr:glutamine--fructose-6-phosphate transaminase (isomerizing) [Deltaproteobacteria bacterium PRO3]